MFECGHAPGLAPQSRSSSISLGAGMIARPVALELAEQIEDEKGLWGAPDPPSTRRASPTNHSTGPARRYLPGCAARAVVAANEIVEISTERSLELEPDLPASMGRGPFGGGDDC